MVLHYGRRVFKVRTRLWARFVLYYLSVCFFFFFFFLFLFCFCFLAFLEFWRVAFFLCSLYVFRPGEEGAHLGGEGSGKEIGRRNWLSSPREGICILLSTFYYRSKLLYFTTTIVHTTLVTYSGGWCLLVAFNLLSICYFCCFWILALALFLRWDIIV